MRLFERLSAWRRARIVERHSFADEAWEAALAPYPFFDRLGGAERARLRELVSLFCAEKEFAAAGDFEMTLQTQLEVAAQACLPILNLDLSLYAGWHGVVVYRGEVLARREVVDDDGIVHQYEEVISGEAMPGGPVVLSWEDVTLAGSDDAPAYNVVIHEFAHKIDMLKGEATGIPPFLPAFHGDIDGRAFANALATAFAAFAAEVDRWEQAGGPDDDMPLLDPYAAENPVEFFAVLSEAFFTGPQDVADEFPELYRLLARYYRQDPLEGLQG